MLLCCSAIKLPLPLSEVVYMLKPDSRVFRHESFDSRKGKYILYWMQQAQRLAYNPALNYAIDLANASGLPLLIAFILNDRIPDANARHYHFMLSGLAETAVTAQRLGIEFSVYAGEPVEIIFGLSQQAAHVVMDHGYLQFQRTWRERLQALLSETAIPYTEIDTEAIVPVHLASPKDEYSAATLRRKLCPLLTSYLEAEPRPEYQIHADVNAPSLPGKFSGNWQNFDELWTWAARMISMEASVAPVLKSTGGAIPAQALLKDFIHTKLAKYADMRNHPELDYQSGLSPYLHFGQVSPVEIILHVLSHTEIDPSHLGSLIMNKAGYQGISAHVAAFAEELIIRRELSMNFCHYNPDYDSYNALPLWARTSLAEHRSDPRTRIYSLDKLEKAETDDAYWNAAQIEMVNSGKMHNYMRMYWGKRIIAWSASPEEAFYMALYLNNKYHLDGRDANAYAGVAWCFGKHDRPWAQRPVYGNLRYMNANGLKRKFNMEFYLNKVAYKEF